MTFTPLPIHELAELLPEMSDLELKDLVGGIKSGGFWGSIITYEGKVLDGRMRQKACELADVVPAYEEWSGQAGSPTAFVIGANLHRRNLTLVQQALVAHNALPYLEAEAKARKEAMQARPGQKVGSAKVPRSSGEPCAPAKKDKSRESAAQAGKLTGVSGDTVRRVGKVMEKGAPELQQAMIEEKVSISKAAKMVDSMTMEEQVAACQKDESVARRTGIDEDKRELQIKRSIPKAVRQAKDLGWTWEEYVEANRKVWDEIPMVEA